MQYNMIIYSKSLIFSTLMYDLSECNEAFCLNSICETEDCLMAEIDNSHQSRIFVDETGDPEETLRLIERIRKRTDAKILCLTTNLVKGARARKEAISLGEVSYFGKADFYKMRDRGELSQLLCYMKSLPNVTTTKSRELPDNGPSTLFAEQGFIISMTDYDENCRPRQEKGCDMKSQNFMRSSCTSCDMRGRKGSSC